jgi:hypothetical protein
LWSCQAGSLFHLVLLFPRDTLPYITSLQIIILGSDLGENNLSPTVHEFSL